MVTIRLARAGCKKRPFCPIVVADSRSPRDGRYIERLGYFNPMASGRDKPLQLAFERFQYWLSKGAQPSARVVKLAKDYLKLVRNDAANIENNNQSFNQAEEIL